MEEDLNLQSIGGPEQPADAISSPAKTATRVVSEYDFRQSGQLNPEHLRQLSALHQIFAAGLANSLGAYLRVAIEVKLVEAEQIPFREFVSRLPEEPYVTSVALMALDERAAIQLDLRLILPMIDLLLGGTGRDATEPREPTEIEEQVLETLFSLICREIQIAWQPVLPVQLQLEKKLQQSQIQKIIEPEDRALFLSFEIVLNEIHGLLNCVFSSTVSNQLIRRLGPQGTPPRRLVRNGSNGRLRERLFNCEFTAELQIPNLALCVRDVMNLAPGAILPLGHAADQTLSFSVNGYPLFGSVAVSCGAARGALLQGKAVATNFRSSEPR